LETLYLHWRNGAKADMNLGKGITAINLGYVTSDPFYALTRFVDSRYVAPNGVNWGYFADPEVDALLAKTRVTFDTKLQDQYLAKVHEKMVDQALMLWVVHDVNPHALSPKVKDFIQAQSWFQDLTTIGMRYACCHICSKGSSMRFPSRSASPWSALCWCISRRAIR
jgi:peptide/nickel transport system substrate-binding protein